MIVSLLRPKELLADFLRAIESRQLPEKFFYIFPQSVQAWLDLCQNPSYSWGVRHEAERKATGQGRRVKKPGGIAVRYVEDFLTRERSPVALQPAAVEDLRNRMGKGDYKNFSRSWEILEKYKGDFVRRIEGDSMEVVSLGSGQGDKDRLILEELARVGKKVFYRPVDSSRPLLEMACEGAEKIGVDSQGLQADLENEKQVTEIFAGRGNRQLLVLLLGNNLGALGPVAFLQKLARASLTGDYFLVDGELIGDDTLAGYDNPVNRRFAFAPLAAVGIQEGDGELVFKVEKDRGHVGIWEVTKSFVPARDLKISLEGREVTLNRGERLRMSSSGKFEPEAFRNLLREVGGFDPLLERKSSDGQFLAVLAKSFDS